MLKVFCTTPAGGTRKLQMQQQWYPMSLLQYCDVASFLQQCDPTVASVRTAATMCANNELGSDYCKVYCKNVFVVQA
jgi:hypothetical protein